jgi:cytochrome c oxidase subunit II
MSNPNRRRALAGLLAIGGAALAVRSGRAQTPRVIEVEARRFKFTPDEIELAAGERVVIALRAIDFPHGFSVPDLAVRADLMPGRVVRVEIQPRTAGTIDFLCDNFCGEHHEEMHGRFLVRP